MGENESMEDATEQRARLGQGERSERLPLAVQLATKLKQEEFADRSSRLM